MYHPGGTMFFFLLGPGRSRDDDVLRIMLKDFTQWRFPPSSFLFLFSLSSSLLFFFFFWNFPGIEEKFLFLSLGPRLTMKWHFAHNERNRMECYAASNNDCQQMVLFCPLVFLSFFSFTFAPLYFGSLFLPPPPLRSALAPMAR